MPLKNDDRKQIDDDDDDIKRHFKSEMMMTLMPDVIEKKWRRHGNLTVSVNDAAPCYGVGTFLVMSEQTGD